MQQCAAHTMTHTVHPCSMPTHHSDLLRPPMLVWLPWMQGLQLFLVRTPTALHMWPRELSFHHVVKKGLPHWQCQMFCAYGEHQLCCLLLHT